MPVKAKFFKDAPAFRKWLEKHAATEKELLVGFYKVGTGKPSINWPESVDQALCFGWIDGIRKSIDSDSYSIRFTPRKPNSIWSAINIQKVADLTEKQLMTTAGLNAFQLRKPEKSGIYSFESAHKELTPEFTEIFRSNPPAWTFFMAQAPYYRKMIHHWVLSAKQEKTRLSRLEKLIQASTKQQRIQF